MNVDDQVVEPPTDTATEPSEKTTNGLADTIAVTAESSQPPSVVPTGDGAESVKSEAPVESSPSTEPTKPDETTNTKPATTDTSTAPETKPKKRLTLQERLALAAKSRAKGKTTTKDNQELPERDESPSQSPSPSPAPASVTPVLPSSQLMTQLAEAKRRIAELESSSSNASQWQAKLAAKDEQIEALMSEGQALSKKELKLNETIKKLRAEARDHNQVVEDLSMKSDEALAQLAALEDVLRVHKFANVDELITAFTQQSIKVAELSAETDNASHWQTKHRELQQVYDEETAAHRQKAAALENAKLDADMARQQHQTELKQRDYRIAELQQQVEAAKREQQVEISRLESKIESLRSATEQSDPIVVENSKLGALQSQYDAAQENWKLLESRLLAKLDHVNQEHDALVKSKAKVVADLKRANVSIAESAERHREATTQIEQLQHQIRELELKLEARSDELAETNRKLERMQQLHTQDRKELASKLQQAEKKANHPVEAPITHSSHGPSLEESFPAFETIDELEVIPPPDSPEMPRSIPATPEDEFDSFSRRSSVPMIEEEQVPRGGHANIQLINKMASSIRRLEVELATIKDDNARLAEEKDAVQLQLLDSLKENQSEENPTNRIAALEEEVAAMKAKELTLLEVLGEKTEQVEELRADIVDLKELCKLQVQQMIELQEKK